MSAAVPTPTSMPATPACRRGPPGEHAEQQQREQGALEEGQERLEGFEHGPEAHLHLVAEDRAEHDQADDQPAADLQALLVRWRRDRTNGR
jgi:uncharacterized protein YbaP (TraB family)